MSIAIKEKRTIKCDECGKEDANYTGHMGWGEKSNGWELWYLIDITKQHSADDLNPDATQYDFCSVNCREAWLEKYRGKDKINRWDDLAMVRYTGPGEVRIWNESPD